MSGTEEKIPVLSKAKYGATIGGGAGAIIAQPIVNIVLYYIHALNPPDAIRSEIDFIVSYGLLFLIGAITAFIGTYIKKETAVDLTTTIKKVSPAIVLVLICLGLTSCSWFSKEDKMSAMIFNAQDVTEVRMSVQNCMQAMDIPTPLWLPVSSGNELCTHANKESGKCEEVMCDGSSEFYCYDGRRIIIPEKTYTSYIRLGAVHYYCDKKYGFGLDKDEKCVLPSGKSAYGECAGGFVLE